MVPCSAGVHVSDTVVSGRRGEVITFVKAQQRAQQFDQKINDGERNGICSRSMSSGIAPGVVGFEQLLAPIMRLPQTTLVAGSVRLPDSAPRHWSAWAGV